ncbi:hypothetical protein [Arsukibacterium sp.]|uniref:hypothetical protein n=1 Tax=Arsukibacterium sp. TaxID=1977258 RepID=UPI002FD8DA66
MFQPITVLKSWSLLLLCSLFMQGCKPAPEPVSSTPATAEVQLEQLAADYVKLVLALGQHDADYVDAYYGPPLWAEQAAASELSAAEIANQALQLREAWLSAPVEDNPMYTLRRHALDRQLVALAAHATALASGQRSSFEQQSRDLYDTVPPEHEFAEFDALLQQLQQLVPGEGNLTERVQAYRQQFVIPADKLDQVFVRAIAECRQRTLKHISLPAGENFELEYVQDKPWSGYNWYKGKAFSLIQINSERPIDISRAVDLGCHEGYPGHHTYNALLEQNLVEQQGWVEFSVYPLFSPQSLIAEGTANYGIEMAFPGDEKWQFERDVLYPLAGLNPARAQEYHQFLQLLGKLSYAGNEVARQYLNQQIDAEQAVQLLMQYSLNSEAEARQRLRFFDKYGAYVINYNWGKDLVKAYVEQADTDAMRWQRFIRLISTPQVPSSLSW